MTREEEQKIQDDDDDDDDEVNTEQQLWSWGAGTDGQLGTSKLEDELLPQLLRIPSLSSMPPISLLACGGAHTVALTSDGKVLSWGRGTSGQLGHGEMVSSLYPKLVSFFECSKVTHVAAGWSHSAFVSDNGCLFTCGDGSFGQLGHGDYRSHCSPAEVLYFVEKPVQQVACGMRHSIVLLRDCSRNQVYGFGSGKRGQLGISAEKIKSVSLPQQTCGFEDVEIISVVANGDHSAACSANGHLYTWGRGFSGTPDEHYPHRLSSSLLISGAVLGWNHALVLTGGGQVYMLGGSKHGVLSDSEKVNKATRHLSDSTKAIFEKVPDLDGTNVIQIASGSEHSVIVTDKGIVKTWGWGEHGQLGLGNTSDQTNPKMVSLGQQVTNRETKAYCGSGFTYVITQHRLPSRIS